MFVDAGGRAYSEADGAYKDVFGSKDYLYKNGNERIGVTGGWTSNGYSYNGVAAGEWIRKDTYMIPGNSSNAWPIVGTANMLDLTEYNRISWEYGALINSIPQANTSLRICRSKALDSKNSLDNESLNVGDMARQTKDISGLSGLWHVTIMASSASMLNFAVYRVWLEK